MTVKLYETDAYLHVFDAIVQSCEPTENGFSVVLDKTAFFPEGGGQPADNGTLGAAVVSDVQIDADGIIRHFTDKPLVAGDMVLGILDRDTRLARMQLHSGEHLISGLIHSMFGFDNVGFHMSDTFATLDTSGALSSEDIAAVELAANRAIYQNKTITVSFPSPDELPSLSYRSKLDLTEGVRLVTIDGIDTCACCAPHVRSTGEIGVVKIIDAIAYKGGTRLTMVSGIHAYADYAALHDSNRDIMRLLSAKRDKTFEFVHREHELVNALRAEIALLSEQLAAARLQTQIVGDTLCGFTEGATNAVLISLAKPLLFDATIIALFSDNGDGTMSYLLTSDAADVRDTAKALNAAFDGKGGGKPQSAQGRISADKNAVLDFFNR
ncbi:MAG: alanyl-tRNA editing protein [Clostridia bacterium]|nr:alanyl-tRNA editing protein [Clostridia bacterium]